jgi:hypothetical protein
MNLPNQLGCGFSILFQLDSDYIGRMQSGVLFRKLGAGILLVGAASWLAVSCSPKPPVTREDRLKWNLATLTNNYQSVGHTNPKWDPDALEALREFARSKTASDDEARVLTDLAAGAAESAVSAGCDDPMVRYLYVRFSSKVKDRPFGERQELYRAAASNLQCSAYAPL